LVLVTGDVTDKGDLQSWTVFRDTISEAGLAAKTLALVGNHDVCGLKARFGWPAKLAKTDLERARKGLLIANQPLRYPWARRVDSRAVIFALDANNSGNLSALNNAVGRIGERQLERFAELLRKFKDVPVKIAAIHHSPNIPETPTAVKRGQAPMSLMNRWAHQIPAAERRAFRHLCLAGGVRLVLHGHLHQAENRRVNGIRMIGAPATTEPIDKTSRLRRYRFFQYSVRGKGGRVDVDLITV
jgi:3',5'-cyclic AMP phosphodiesterase CpdA